MNYFIYLIIPNTRGRLLRSSSFLLYCCASHSNYKLSFPPPLYLYSLLSLVVASTLNKVIFLMALVLWFVLWMGDAASGVCTYIQTCNFSSLKLFSSCLFSPLGICWRRNNQLKINANFKCFGWNLNKWYATLLHFKLRKRHPLSGSQNSSEAGGQSAPDPWTKTSQTFPLFFFEPKLHACTPDVSLFLWWRDKWHCKSEDLQRWSQNNCIHGNKTDG